MLKLTFGRLLCLLFQCTILVPTCLASGASNRRSSYLDTLSPNQRKLYEVGMKGLDLNWGGVGTFLFDSVRYSAWYAVGLLARNENDDVVVASQVLRDVVSYQFKDPSKLWYGTFKDDPDAPDPGDTYTPLIYNSYDPNQALFVGTSFIIVIEEFQHLLEPDLVILLKESMYNATVGDGYRNGGINGDNLYPVYSNPWFMRIMAATYVGNMMGDANMSYWAEVWTKEGIDTFDIYNTLPEYNCGTYNGVVLYALSLWGYMPRNSTIVSRATDLISKIWVDVGMYYNPTLHTLGGPWDRAYGYDMRDYFGILGAQIAGLVGGIDDKNAPLPVPLVGSQHYSDAAILTLTPILAKFHDPYVPDSVISQLKTLNGNGHSFFAQAVSPPFDNVAYPRNYSSWTGDGLSVGGIQVDNYVVGGAATNPSVYVPGSILWSTPSGQVGWILHYPTSSVITAVAGPSNLTVSYPPSKAFPDNSTTSNIMSFLISGFRHTTLSSDFLSNGTAELPGLKLNVSGNLVELNNRTLVYGATTINGLSFYNLTYFIPENFTEVPQVVFSFTRA